MKKLRLKYPLKVPLNLQNIPPPIFPGLVQKPNDFVIDSLENPLENPLE